MNSKLELRKVRDFGETINDTFLFIKQNFKPLLISLVYICGFFILAAMVTGILQQLKVLAMSKNVSNGDVVRFFGYEYFLSLLFSWLTYTSISIVAFSYVALYVEKDKQPPTVEEVWGYFKYYFFRVFLSSIPITLLFMVGFAFCFLPGFYLWPVCSLMLAVMVLENSTLGYAFNRGFELVKNHWWETFGVVAISTIIVYFGMTLVSLPSLILTKGAMFIPNAETSVTAVVLTSIVQYTCQFIWVIPSIAIALSFYSLTERKEGTGLLERIEKIGSNDPEVNLPTEQF